MQKECIRCKAKFEAKKNTAKFCSNSCRVMYNRNSPENKEKRLSLSDRVDLILEILVEGGVKNPAPIKKNAPAKSNVESALDRKIRELENKKA